MGAEQAKRLVVIGTLGAGVLSLVAAYRNPNAKRAPFRVVLGVFIAGVILAVVAEVAPKIAASFAMLLLVTAAFVVGGDAWAGISAITAVDGSSSSSPPGTARTPIPPNSAIGAGAVAGAALGASGK